MVLEGAKRWWLTPSYGDLPKEYFSAVVCDDVQVDHGSTPQFAKCMGGSIAVKSIAQREDRRDWRDIAPRQQLLAARPSASWDRSDLRKFSGEWE
jgi:hypothetical protein